MGGYTTACPATAFWRRSYSWSHSRGILIPVIPWLWILVPMFFLMGLANNGIDVGCNSMLVWIYGDRVGPFLNGLHFFFGVGAFAAPLVAAQVVQSTGGVAWAYWLFALVALSCAVLIWNLPSPAAHVVSRGGNGNTNAPIFYWCYSPPVFYCMQGPK